MRINYKTVAAASAALSLALAASALNSAAAGAAGLGWPASAPTQTPSPSPTASPGTAALPRRTATPLPTPMPMTEDGIERRESDRKGIMVDAPRVYDDAMLQQMLKVAEARLATLQLIDQTQLLSRLGATSGASQRTSGFGLNVAGAPLPQVMTTSRGATGTTTEIDSVVGTATSSQGATTSTGTAGNTTATSSGLNTVSTDSAQTVSGLASQDVVTTRAPFGPPGATSPAPTTTLPSSGFSVASSDVLNEQMQLTAEINALRLMLGGDLSGHFVKERPEAGYGVTKLKTTLGFPVALSPDEDYRDAVAVVEVEVNKPNKLSEIEEEVVNLVRTQFEARGQPPTGPAFEADVAKGTAERMKTVEGPMITALLPRDKTYNVAAISDKSVSLGGGVATQILGISGSWLFGRKTHYLVQDQDTVAKTFTPTAPGSVGFMWEFRPVLGRRYVRAGMKQAFVQLAFAAYRDAEEGEIGQVHVRTYWRRYDRKRGIPGDIIPNTLKTHAPFEIPRVSLAARPPAFTASNIEEVRPGEVLVNLRDRFLPGTYVRVGSDIINAMPRLSHEHSVLRFTAPVADVVTKETFIVAHDGTEVPLKLTACDTENVKDAAGRIVATQTTRFVLKGTPTVETVDDTKSRVKAKFAVQKIERRGRTEAVLSETDPPVRQTAGGITALALIVGDRVFAYSELRREARDELSVVVPTSALTAKPEVSITTLFPLRECRTEPTDIKSKIPPRQSERLAVLEHRATETRFLLTGRDLGDLEVLSPAWPQPPALRPLPGTDEKAVRTLTLTAEQLQTNRQILLLRKGEGNAKGKTFFVAIPEIEPKKPEPPRAKERIPVGADEAEITGGAMDEVEAVTFRGKKVDFDAVDENTLRLKNLRALGVTGVATTQRVELKFKSEAKPKRVELEVVTSKVEAISR